MVAGLSRKKKSQAGHRQTKLSEHLDALVKESDAFFAEAIDRDAWSLRRRNGRVQIAPQGDAGETQTARGRPSTPTPWSGGSSPWVAANVLSSKRFENNLKLRRGNP